MATLTCYMHSLRQKRIYAYIGFYSIYYIYAVRAIFNLSTPIDLLIPFIICAFSVGIAAREYECHNKTLITSFKWLIFFSWPILIPIILLKLKRFKGILFIALHSLLLFAPPFSLQYYIMYYTSYYGAS